MTWTQFWDMSSGGGQKLSFKHCFIEAPEDEAKIVFQNRWGRNPDRVTCTCCGPDYAVHEYGSLEQATAYHRRCAFDGTLDVWIEEPERPNAEPGSWGAYSTLDAFVARENIEVIRASDITEGDRLGALREEGFVWQG